MLVEKFEIYGVKITGKNICELKKWACSFLLMPPNKSLTQVLIIPQAEGKYPFPPNNVFWKFIFVLPKTGENYGAEKTNKIKLE